jgi:hypothetical protein
MSTENRVHLEIDQQRRIGIADVISMLKGLRSEAKIKIVQASDAHEDAFRSKRSKGNSGSSRYEISSQDSFDKSLSVKGNTDLPQIRELNDIAALLRSMDMPQSQLSS